MEIYATPERREDSNGEKDNLFHNNGHSFAKQDKTGDKIKQRYN